MSRHHHEDLFDTLVADTDPPADGSEVAPRSPHARRHGRGAVTRAPDPKVGRRWRRVAVAITAVAALMAIAVASGTYLLAARLDSHVGRIQGAFEGLSVQERPAVQAGTTILLAGLDTHSDEPTTGSQAGGRPFVPGSARSDALMLVHISADGKAVAVVSIPRDSWVEIPGRGKNKINAAYSDGGPALLIRTVEALTGVRVDHFAVVDFHGLKAVVDAVGGVDVQIAQETTEGRRQGLHKGTNHLDGEGALAYVRERHELVEGEFDRERRQENLIRTIIAKATALNPVHDPIRTYRLLDAGTRAISVDDGFTTAEMRGLATKLGGLGAGDISFMLAPVLKVGWEGPLNVVYLDDQRCRDLWYAMTSDTMSDYVTTHRSALLPAVPR